MQSLFQFNKKLWRLISIGILIWSSSASVFAITLHAVLVADTNDASIGVSVQKDLDRLTDLVKDIAAKTGLKLNLIQIKGNDVNKDNILHAVNSLRFENTDTETHDVVFFHWSGHGSNYGHSELPSMFLGSNRGGDFEVSDIMRKLQNMPYRPRLSIVMADACNKEIQSSNSNIEYRSPSAANNYTLLFQHYKGWITASSSEVGEFSYGNDQKGGAFTDQFIHFFNQEVAAENQNPSWQTLFFGTDGRDDKQNGATKLLLIGPDDGIKIKQTPQAKMAVTREQPCITPNGRTRCAAPPSEKEGNDRVVTWSEDSSACVLGTETVEDHGNTEEHCCRTEKGNRRCETKVWW